MTAVKPPPATSCPVCGTTLDGDGRCPQCAAAHLPGPGACTCGATVSSTGKITPAAVTL